VNAEDNSYVGRLKGMRDDKFPKLLWHYKPKGRRDPWVEDEVN